MNLDQYLQKEDERIKKEDEERAEAEAAAQRALQVGVEGARAAKKEEEEK